jgi:hypothetical protein
MSDTTVFGTRAIPSDADQPSVTWMVDRGYQEFLNNDFDINEGASWSDCGEPGEMPTLPPDVWV